MISINNNNPVNQNPIVDGNLVINHLDLNSIKQIAPESDHFLIYGFRCCFYRELLISLEVHSKILLNQDIKKVYDYKIGSQNSSPYELMTAEERIMDRINYNFENNYTVSKSGITNFVLENFKRELEGKPLMSILFCVDFEGNSYSFDGKAIAEKNSNENRLITHSELRRCYKLCEELILSPRKELRQLAETARKTIKFVKIFKKNNQAILVEIPPFWLHPGWNEAWQRRKEFRQTQDIFASLELDAQYLENLVEFNSVEAKNTAMDPDNSVREISKALEKLFYAKQKAFLARKIADSFYDAKIKPIMSDKNRSIHLPKSKKHQWREQLIRLVQKYQS